MTTSESKRCPSISTAPNASNRVRIAILPSAGSAAGIPAFWRPDLGLARRVSLIAVSGPNANRPPMGVKSRTAARPIPGARHPSAAGPEPRDGPSRDSPPRNSRIVPAKWNHLADRTRAGRGDQASTRRLLAGVRRPKAPNPRETSVDRRPRDRTESPCPEIVPLDWNDLGFESREAPSALRSFLPVLGAAHRRRGRHSWQTVQSFDIIDSITRGQPATRPWTTAPPRWTERRRAWIGSARAWNALTTTSSG